MLRNKRGEFMILPSVYIGMWAIGFIGAALTMSTTAYILKDSHRAREAVKLCYCMEKGSSEYVCKADATVIEVEEGDILDACEAKVEGMSKPAILAYIKDDVMMSVAKNYGNVN